MKVHLELVNDNPRWHAKDIDIETVLDNASTLTGGAAATTGP